MATKTGIQQDRNFSQLLAEHLNLDMDYSWVLEFVESNFDPEEVFGAEQLTKWAEANGFISEEDLR